MPRRHRQSTSWKRKNALRIFRFANSLVLIFSVIAYLSVWISPADLWISGFVALSIPFFLIANTFFVLLWWWRKRWYALYSLLMLVIGFPFWQVSLSFNWSALAEEDKNGLSVLSYNVREFDVYQGQDKEYTKTKELIKWVKNDTSDIKCFQDFYNSLSSSVFNTQEKLSENKNNQKYQWHIRYTSSSHNRGKFGLAIQSKFPVIRRGEVLFKQKSDNGAIFIDVVKEKDTIRIYNIHLESMSINQNELRPIDEPEHTFWYASRRLKRGFRKRALQIDAILSHVQASPYPVILCGDFNDLPYSYTYFRLRREMTNAFESKGWGTGFTFNGKLFFLRIDNQFYSEQLTCFHFKTHREVPFSDHYPIKAVYKLNE